MVKRTLEKKDEQAAPCGAKVGRGRKCEKIGMKNGRCRLHGGLSTGPRTVNGKSNSSKNSFKHGYYSYEFRGLSSGYKAIADKDEDPLLKAL